MSSASSIKKKLSKRGPRTTIRRMNRDLSIGDGPGPVRTHLKEGDRVEIGGEAASRDYLIAYRVQQYGQGWRRLGPFAVIPKNALQ